MILKPIKTKHDVARCYELYSQLYPFKCYAEYEQKINAMANQGYQVYALVHDYQYLALCGFYIRYHFLHGKEMWIDDFIVHKAFRHQGFGKYLLQEIENFAIENNCNHVMLTAHNPKAESFWSKQKYTAYGKVFRKSLIQ